MFFVLNVWAQITLLTFKTICILVVAVELMLCLFSCFLRHRTSVCRTLSTCVTLFHSAQVILDYVHTRKRYLLSTVRVTMREFFAHCIRLKLWFRLQINEITVYHFDLPCVELQLSVNIDALFLNTSLVMMAVPETCTSCRTLLRTRKLEGNAWAVGLFRRPTVLT